MGGRNDRRGPVAGTRHAWFLEFEHDFREIVGAGSAFGPEWTLQASEAQWRVWMQAPGAHQRTVSIDLPPNYALFQPAAVAANTALRLRGVAGGAAGASDTSAGAAPLRS